MHAFGLVPYGAFSVLIHLSENSLYRMLDFSRRSLSPTGELFANVNCGSQADGRWRDFPLMCRTHEFYREAFEKQSLRFVGVGALRDYGHVARPRPESEELSQRMFQSFHMDCECLINS